MSDLRFPCEVCGKLIWKGWFAPGVAGSPPSKVKCGACSNPPRAEAPDPDPFSTREPDLINVSSNEHLSVADRINLMRGALLFPPFTLIPERSVTQSIHDLKLTVGRIRNTIALYDRAIERGTSEETLAKGANRMLSDTECLILAWRRGGHLEYERVRRLQRDTV